MSLLISPAMHRPSIVAALLLAVACKPEDTTPPEPGGATPAQQASASNFAIDPERMFASLEHLASDEMGGRYTRTEEDLGRAADYIAQEYRKVSLAPVAESFRASFQLPVGSEPGPDVHFWVETSGSVIEVPMEHYATLDNGEGKPVFGDVVRVGKGAPKAVRDTVALIELADLSTIASRTEALAKAGAMAVVAVVPEKPEKAEPLETKIPVVAVAASEAAAWLPASSKAGKRFEDLQFSLAAEPVPVHEPSFNVLSWIPGTEHPEEIVILGAHYDHIGRGDSGAGHCRGKGEDDICNGADDNGSGTVVVVELARAIAESGVTPKCTLVFALFAGEELGLLGSNAMAAELPKAAPFDSGKIVAMINIDMVGRLRPELGLAVGGVGSSSGWMPLLDGVDARGMPIMFDKAITMRSDHASFYKQNIPVLFFFTHVHDDYHGPGDEMSLINRDGMGTIAQYVMDITRQVADGYALPFTPPGTPDEGLVGALPGDNPKTIVKRIGFPEAAPEGTPADAEAAEPGSESDAAVKPTGS